MAGPSSSGTRSEETRERDRWRTLFLALATCRIFRPPPYEALFGGAATTERSALFRVDEKRESSPDCLFRRLVETPVAEWSEGQERVVLQTDKLVVIQDKFPAVEHHLLVLPRTPIANVKSLEYTKHDADLMEEMLDAGREALRAVGAPGDESSWRFGFHIPPYNSIEHLHMHCLAGKSSFRGKVKFGIPFFFADGSAVLKELRSRI
ncbi:Histidine triad nucleotide-binding protein 3 [Hondaea fermentalgiana]|uniref:Histidine triad nucleotide-binding protein 3 n=1 Tax=Hondaea fermentalgiana TaxID=2315210 RepID=A0A2R5G2L5_9STRA|nr:Histidine triad nucleotide-binding protein 3 [Hondaea fermentalgiana]|eukprot:GBG25240.1 Histidine triad nucleotide-binding protein 3 [Hondaea fermentalgiana]